MALNIEAATVGLLRLFRLDGLKYNGNAYIEELKFKVFIESFTEYSSKDGTKKDTTKFDLIKRL